MSSRAKLESSLIWNWSCLHEFLETTPYQGGFTFFNNIHFIPPTAISTAIGIFTSCAFILLFFHPVVAQEADFSSPRASDWAFTVGGGPLVAPNYEGSKHYIISGLPMVGASWRDTVSLSAADGLKVTAKPLSDQGFFVSGGIGYWLGRKEGVDKHHGDTLRGLGDLSGGAIGKLETGYRYHAFNVGLGVARDIKSDRDGTTVTPYASYKIFQSRHFNLNATVSTTWADDNYMQHMFGITPLQSLDSLKHYAPFKAEAGLKDATLRLTADYDITSSMSLFAMTGVSRLLGDAADSPIVKTQGSSNQITGSIGLKYRF